MPNFKLALEVFSVGIYNIDAENLNEATKLLKAHAKQETQMSRTERIVHIPEGVPLTVQITPAMAEALRRESEAVKTPAQEENVGLQTMMELVPKEAGAVIPSLN